MSFSGFSQSKKSKKWFSLDYAGFVFSVEALIALVLFVGFLSIAHFSAQTQNNYIKELSVKNALSDSLIGMDNTGYASQIFDENISTNDKVIAINLRLTGSLPANVGIRTQISEIDANPSPLCRSSQTFSDCFAPSAIIASTGFPAPTGANVLHEKRIYASRQGPESCSINYPVTPIFLSGNGAAPRAGKASFNAYLNGVFFAQASDFNINFGTVVTPPDKATCDQDIRVDLNAWLPNDMNTSKRLPADIMLVLDKSGSMSWDGMLALTQPLGIFVSGSYAYIAYGSAGLRDVSISDPSNPTLLDTFSDSGTANDVYVNGDTAYLADGSGGLDIINVANRSSAQIQQSYRIGNTTDVYFSGSTLYAATTNAGNIFYFDTSNGLAQNNYLTIGRSTSLSTGAQSFIPNTGTIQNFSINLRKSGTPTRDLNIFLRASLSGPNLAKVNVLQASLNTTFTWVNVSFPAPVTVTPSSTYYFVLSTDANDNSNYYRWGTNTTNPYSDGSAYQQGLTVSGSDAFVRQGFAISAGIQAFDASASPKLTYLSTYPLTGVTKIFAQPNYTYVSVGAGGLMDINYTNKSSPSLASSLALAGTSNSVFVSGNYAYVAGGSAGLQVVDITNPAAPSLCPTCTYNTPGTAFEAFPYSDGNVYVADNSSLQGISAAIPSALNLQSNYYTSYNYQHVWVANDWAFVTANTSNISLIAFNIHNGPKIDQLKVSANNFLDYNGWKGNYDQVGLETFQSTASNPVDQRLLKITDTNKAIIKQKIKDINAGGSTDMADGMRYAQAELIGPDSNKSSIKFEILLSDGVANVVNSDCNANPKTATNCAVQKAQQAHDSNIKVYTIGFGPDADVATLQSIATDSNGKYYPASDANALSDVFNYIANDIQEGLSEFGKITISDSNISIPLSIQISNCTDFKDIGYGICHQVGDKNYLDYNIGKMDNKTPWKDYFVMNIPCNDQKTCGITHITLPFSGTLFSWTDSNGVPQHISWDSNRDINFSYRQVGFDILNPTSSSTGGVTFDVNVKNTGKLDANNFQIGFYPGGVNQPVVSLISPISLNAGTFSFIRGKNIQSSDFWVGLTSVSGNRQWCPVEAVEIKCNGSAKTAFYVVDAWAWIK